MPKIVGFLIPEYLFGTKLTFDSLQENREDHMVEPEAETDTSNKPNSETLTPQDF